MALNIGKVVLDIHVKRPPPHTHTQTVDCTEYIFFLNGMLELPCFTVLVCCYYYYLWGVLTKLCTIATRIVTINF